MKKIDELSGFDQQRTRREPRKGSAVEKSSRPDSIGLWLVLWGFDDVVFKPGTAFGKQPIGEHLTRPFDG